MTRLIITKGDVELFWWLWQLRMLTMEQIRRLRYFNATTGHLSNSDNVRKRLSRLVKEGYLTAQDILKEGSMQLQRVFLLGEMGLPPLRHLYGIEQRRIYKSSGEHALRHAYHALWISECGVRLVESLRDADASLLKLAPLNIPFYHSQAVADPSKKKHTERFVTQEDVIAPNGKRVRIRPDLLCGLAQSQFARLFYLEADRGSEGPGQIAEKQLAYHYYRSTDHWKRYAPAHDFRVLFITTTKHRIRRLRRALKNRPGFDLFAFTTLEAIRNHHMLHDPIWHTPDGVVRPLLKRTP